MVVSVVLALNAQDSIASLDSPIRLPVFAIQTCTGRCISLSCHLFSPPLFSNYGHEQGNQSKERERREKGRNTLATVAVNPMATTALPVEP
jgi:hypothetical protein